MIGRFLTVNVFAIIMDSKTYKIILSYWSVKMPQRTKQKSEFSSTKREVVGFQRCLHRIVVFFHVISKMMGAIIVMATIAA